MASSVENRTARAFPVFRIDRLASVIPILSDSSVSRVPRTPPLRVGTLNFPQGWVLRSDQDRLGEFQFRKVPRIALGIERHKTIRVHHGM
jgi:hypothetical protein